MEIAWRIHRKDPLSVEKQNVLMHQLQSQTMKPAHYSRQAVSQMAEAVFNP